jgi:crotonobetainyl-CoA:carnitine CoA-transferase CaiB-like acyl-CoA transferase
MPLTTSGVLSGVRIVEIAGVGPVPFAAMLLADMGAQVITVDRLTPSGLGLKKEPRFDPTTRSRSSIAVDLKSDQGRSIVLRLVGKADALIEGFRPGVMERLGLGPSVCAQHNQRLVFGRATGWGQDGPLSQNVGHDLNYLAITGALAMIGPRKGVPSVPLNLLGDYAGGGVYLALGLLAALLEAKVSGDGQVVDAAMVDGVESMLTHYFGYLASNRLTLERESNYFDGGAPFGAALSLSGSCTCTPISAEPTSVHEVDSSSAAGSDSLQAAADAGGSSRWVGTGFIGFASAANTCRSAKCTALRATGSAMLSPVRRPPFQAPSARSKGQ